VWVVPEGRFQSLNAQRIAEILERVEGTAYSRSAFGDWGGSQIVEESIGLKMSSRHT
jgi:hypothetical protein